MTAKFTQSFKLQAVEKALNRSDGTSLETVAASLGVGYSTLQKWMAKSRNHELESDMNTELLSAPYLTKEKRPQDWSLEERLEMVIACAALDEEKVSEYCRERGLYAHHIKQWKQNIVKNQAATDRVKTRSKLKDLQNENKALKKEVTRKDKALAETAALLVLQKKVHAIWGNDGGNSQ